MTNARARTILELCKIDYNYEEDYYTFYSRLKSNMNDRLFPNEFLSQTFEDILIVWCLQIISPKLPKQIIKFLEQKTIIDTDSIDLEKDIFEHVSKVINNQSSDNHNEDKKQIKVKEEINETLDLFIGCDEITFDFIGYNETDKSKDKYLTLVQPENSIEPINSIDDLRIEKFSDSESFDNIRKDKHESSFSCVVCEEVLPGKVDLKSHMKKNHFSAQIDNELLENLVQSKTVVKTDVDKDVNEKIDIPRRAKIKLKLKNHNCRKCYKYFSTEKILSNHLNKCVGYSCSECSLVFKTKVALNNHSRKHKPPISEDEKSKVFVCSECGNTFTYQSNLTRHKRICHTPQVKHLPCEICGKLFSNSWNLKAHINNHTAVKVTKPRDFHCDICTRSFITDEERKSHVCKHYACDCGLKFVRERNLRLHKRSHNGETIYSCELCESLFDKKKQLNTHKANTHSDKKKYSCDQCPRAFKNSSGLKSHKLSHNGAKPFSCDLCQTSFKTKSNLQSHIRTHSKEFPFECEGCGARFRSIVRVKHHREKEMCGVTPHDYYNTDSLNST